MFSMRWPIVSLIFRREVRDQLRDRRTLFMIFVLPILLYPMLGLGIAQLSMAFEQRARSVVVVGAEHLPAQPPLLDAGGTGFNPALFDIPEEARRYDVLAVPAGSPWSEEAFRSAALRRGEVDAILLIPPNIEAQIGDESQSAPLPIRFDSSSEQSLDTYRTVSQIVNSWRDLILRQRLQRDEKTESYLRPIEVQATDVARIKGSSQNIWARMIPFILVLMSLTGAFYPAVDLCAGEKERGTMETLLISPASRPEIVIGKFLTVVLASIVSALANLGSMGITALSLSYQLGGMRSGAGGTGLDPMSAIAPPSLVSMFWMILLLIPLSVFFSALCVALAAMARSMKEGQYYLTPLYLMTLPLVFITLAPGIKLDLFTSLVPVTGASLLLRSLMSGDYVEARRHFVFVLVPLLIYGALALRWAVDQFRSESVLFRESERFDIRGWIVHVFRDREPTPNGAMALLCFVLMICAAFFVSGFLGLSLWGVLGSQLLFILLPSLVLTLALTTSPRRTLLLYWPRGRELALAAGLAVAVHPLVFELRQVVEFLFPMSETIKQTLGRLMGSIPNLGTALVLFAVVPAICEEVAFRGFILQGLRRTYRTASAIVLSAFFFGFFHVLSSIFQQFFNATLLGLILGLLAVRSKSLLPGIVFHAINNGLALVVSAVIAGELARGWAPRLYRDTEGGLYHESLVILSAFATIALLTALVRIRRERIDDLEPTAAAPPVHDPRTA